MKRKEKRVRTIINSVPNTTTLGDVDINAISPKAQIVFIQNDTNEVEMSIHFDPPVKEDKDYIVPSCQVLAVEVFNIYKTLLQLYADQDKK